MQPYARAYATKITACARGDEPVASMVQAQLDQYRCAVRALVLIVVEFLCDIDFTHTRTLKQKTNVVKNEVYCVTVRIEYRNVHSSIACHRQYTSRVDAVVPKRFIFYSSRVFTTNIYFIVHKVRGCFDQGDKKSFLASSTDLIL